MERLLQRVRLPELEAVFFPVRHHSPVCAFQLRRFVREFRPETILIEGPENADDIIPVLTDERTRLPAAIYYFYRDKKRYLSEEGADYHCYYPFLYSSPEYAAMEEAKRLGIPAAFIDLPYSEILIHTPGQAGLRQEQERHSYADDRWLLQNRFQEQLCEKTGVRDFEEFWEKYFEIQGLRLTPEAFLRQMGTYCAYTRNNTPSELLEADGTLAREQHMAWRIREAGKRYHKLLVVTGGFHSQALAEQIQTEVKPLTMHSIAPHDEGCYPIAYSYEAADALRGYASGMPYPGFYDRISRALSPEKSPEGVYQTYALDLLTRTAKESARQHIPVSMADITAGWSMAKGLAALRGCPEPGFAEVYDGVTSAFIKGEKTEAAALPLRLLQAIGTGSGIGKVGDRHHVPPLLQDFLYQCETFSLHVDTSVPQKVTIALFKGERELAKSRFLHRVAFLNTDFCEQLKGPNPRRGTDRSRVREIWKCCRTPQTDAALIEYTAAGATVEEACRSLASKRLRRERRCAMAAEISADCFLMGIPLSGADRRMMEQIMAEDGDFFSLGEGLYAFDRLQELHTLYRMKDPALPAYIRQCFEALLPQIPSMAQCPDTQTTACTQIFRLLYGITGRHLQDRREAFFQSLITLTRREEKNPVIYGSAMGLLYAMDERFLTEAEDAMRGYLLGGSAFQKDGAGYLTGLFETARDILLGENHFLEMVDRLLGQMDYEDFMEALPSLRLAFQNFTPSETQQIARGAAALHHQDESNILNQKARDELLCAFGAQLDAEIFQEIRANGGV